MIADLLKQSGYKITKPRALVAEYLQKNKRPLSAVEIYRNFKNQMDQVTVYRVLEVFEQVGLVWREQVDNQSLYYLADKQHHHVICRKCGQTKCLPCEHVFKQIKGFKQIEHQLILTGICEKCF